MRINLYEGNVPVTYAYNSTQQIYTPTAWDMTEICTLPDAVACSVHEEKNGAYELSMTYISQGTNADKIATDCILGVYCPLRDSVGENYFRIYRVEKDLGGHVQISARHVSNDLIYNGVTHGGLSEVSPVPGGILTFAGADVSHAYSAWLRHAANARIPFTFGGDAEYATETTGVGFQMDFCTATSVRAYLGGEDLQGFDLTARQAFQGSAYEWDKWEVNLWESRGQDRDQQITYGTNLAELISDDNTDDVYTYVCGFYLETDGTAFKKHVGTLYRTNYYSLFAVPRIKMLDCSAEVVNQYPQGATTAQITALLNKMAQAEQKRMNAAGVPIRSITVDVVEAAISNVYLCDTLSVLYKRNGIELNTRMEIVSYVWDVIMQRYTEITLGAIQMDLAKEIAKNGRSSAVAGLQSNVATLQDGYAKAMAAIENIIEATDSSGSGVYTKAIKFSDGTMICTIQKDYSGAISTQWGAMYYSASISLGSWPVSFTGIPYVTIGLRANTDCLPGAIKNVSATSAGSTYIYRPASTASATAQVVVTAIGRWQ